MANETSLFHFESLLHGDDMPDDDDATVLMTAPSILGTTNFQMLFMEAHTLSIVDTVMASELMTGCHGVFGCQQQHQQQ